MLTRFLIAILLVGLTLVGINYLPLSGTLKMVLDVAVVIAVALWLYSQAPPSKLP